MSSEKTQITKKTMVLLFLGTFPLMALQKVIHVLVLCGWMLRGVGWQNEFQIGRWLWLTILVVYSLLYLPMLIFTLLKNRNLRFLVWCKMLVFWVSSLAGIVLLLRNNIVVAIYVLFIGSIVHSGLNFLVKKTPTEKQLSLFTSLFCTATIIAFSLNNASLVFALIIAELLTSARILWMHLQTVRRLDN